MAGMNLQIVNGKYILQLPNPVYNQGEKTLKHDLLLSLNSEDKGFEFVSVLHSVHCRSNTEKERVACLCTLCRYSLII